MEHLWNMERLQQEQQQQKPDSQALNLSTDSPWGGKNGVLGLGEEDEEEPPMVCMICEDKATGLHYGIITCEG